MELRIMTAPLLSWESQVVQYPEFGPPGIEYFAGVVEGYAQPVDCLLWRGGDKRVHGILNYYSIDYPPWEKAGNVNVWVQPGWQRKGIGSRLIRVAQRRWGPINWQQQQYTEAGAAFARHMMGEK